MDSVTIRVPATTANLGPGYDCLGVALQLFNEVKTRRSRERQDSGAMADAAAEQFFRAAKVPPFDFEWSVSGEVPRSRGLGSSVTVRLGLLHGLNELTGKPLSKEQLFRACAELEGHPDNAAPAAFGGFTVAGGPEIARVPVSSALYFVLLIPDFEIATPDARRVLPPTLDRLAAARSCANACRITAAFATQRYELLRGAFEDELHQPFREKELIPFLSDTIRAGEAVGALGGFLSGSGSTICCLTLEEPERVAEAMLQASGQAGARAIITSADPTGAQRV